MSRSGNGDPLRVPESVATAPPLAEDPGRGDVEPTEVLGRGGNATVYAATVADGRTVALKEPHLGSDASEAVAERFRDEAETWAGLDDHPHVVTVHAWGTDPHPWLALEYMDEGSLADHLGECSLERALWTGARVADALDHAHAEGVAHLDLKPENVLLRGTDDDSWPVPGVADWGLARALRAGPVNLEGLSPRYAAPEQFAPGRFGSPGAATDVYQLGVVLYEVLVDAPPFGGPPQALRDAVLEEAPPAASGRAPELPAAVDDVLDRALAKRPGERYDSAAAFRDALEGLLADRTEYERSDGPAGGGGGDVATTAGGSPYERALALADEGFVRLTEAYLARREPAPPLAAWRRGVTLADAHAGRAVERTVPAGDGGERVPLVDRLLDGLADGTDHVVLGPPGSGKSTVCKQVACEWFDAGHGPVFYRESGQGSRFERPDALSRRAADADGHALVVVEDAVRPRASAAFELLDRVRDAEDVTVLVDARESEWREAGGDGDGLGATPVERGRDALEPVYVPRPDEHEHERFVAAVEDAAEDPLDVDVEQLRADVERAAGGDEAGTEPGALFYLLHRLTALARDPLSDGEATTLTAAVADVHDRLAAAGEDVLDVGVCANLLNAAGVGVHPELLYAVVPGTPLAVDEAVELLAGRVLFPREADWTDGTRAYPAIHEAWSTAFLAHLHEAADGDELADERFGRVATAVLALADDDGRREQVDGALGGDAPYLARVERDPGGWAEETAEALYGLGRERPKLAPLYGDGDDDSVALPDACPERVAHRRPVWLGELFLAGGYHDRAERAFERLPAGERDAERLLGLTRVARGRGNLDEAVSHGRRCLDRLDDDRPTDRARARLHLGRALSSRGDVEEAESHLEAALERFESTDDHRLTTTLDGLGIAAALRNDYERAREFLERSLEVSRRLGDRRSAADTLNNLGEVSRHQGELAASREYHEQSLEVRRELGDRSGQASSLNNLGVVAKSQGEYERATEYLERSLETASDIGYRQGEMNAITNLGNVLRRRGEYERAREYQRRGLNLARDIGYRRGELASLSNLGENARYVGDYETAREHHEAALEIARSIDSQYGESLNLAHLGETARLQGEYDRASERLERALEIAEAVGEAETVTLSHYHLGTLATARGDLETAHERFERALETVDPDENPVQRAQVRLARGRLALARGDRDLARERADAARESFAARGGTHWVARSRRLLGRVAAARGEPDAAREHLRAALETFEAVGAPQDALATLERLVETCREAGDDDAVTRWRERAGDLLADAPDPVAERHREWVRGPGDG